MKTLRKNLSDLDEDEKIVQTALGTMWPTYEEMAIDTTEHVIYVQTEYLNIPYEIRKGGGSPCCYVRIPSISKMDTEDYDTINIDVHGGVTYGDKDGWVGWDHSHSGDFSFYDLKYKGAGGFKNGRRFSFPELIEECKRACEQIVVLLHEEGLVFNKTEWILKSDMEGSSLDD